VKFLAILRQHETGVRKVQGFSGRLGVKVNTERTKNSVVVLQNTHVQTAALVIIFRSGLAKNILEMILSLSTK
jgi:hypothetical protein